MPDTEKGRPFRLGLFRRNAQTISNGLADLHRSTYYTDRSNRDQLDKIRADINDSIKNIMSNTSDTVGEPNISRLYERIFQRAKINSSDTLGEFEKIFSDNEFVSNLTASYLDNRWVKATDVEIDQILRYMPKLQEAIDTLADNVLSADSFSKDFLTLTNTLPDSDLSRQQFDRNIEDLKRKYKLIPFVKKIYSDMSKYGEAFVYRVPYDKAIQRLLDKKDYFRSISVSTTNESVVITCDDHSGTLEEAVTWSNESATIPIPRKTDGSNASFSTSDINGDINFNIRIENGIISSIVEKERKAYNELIRVNEQSIFNEAFGQVDRHGRSYKYDNSFNTDIKDGSSLPKHHNFDSTLGDKLELPEDETPGSQDGFKDVSKANTNKIKPMNGAIQKQLKREQVLPIMLNDVCLGYYYFEFDNGMDMFDERLQTTGMINSLTGLRTQGRAEAFDAQMRREELLRNVANALAERIDNRFVDSNQELKKEIYYILKYNDDYNSASGYSHNNIRISYIPPEDMFHFYFELNEDTGRGISDLNLSLIPAKLWVAITVANSLSILTRGNDKRVYYVRQSVESNISKTLLKTINEIKKSNFGIRQVENINSMLNITGRFNDYVIPRGADGQSPIEFEVMQGQQIDIKTDLLNLLEENAINPTHVPIETIQSRQSPDYAMQLTMSSSKFLRFVYERQSLVQEIFSEYFSDLYDMEYNTSDRISLTLPPPLFINVTNTNQLLTNVSDYANQIIETYLADEQDEQVKQIALREMKIDLLGSYMNRSHVEDIISKARQMKAKKDAESGGNNGGGGDEGY